MILNGQQLVCSLMAFARQCLDLLGRTEQAAAGVFITVSGQQTVIETCADLTDQQPARHPNEQQEKQRARPPTVTTNDRQGSGTQNTSQEL